MGNTKALCVFYSDSPSDSYGLVVNCCRMGICDEARQVRKLFIVSVAGLGILLFGGLANADAGQRLTGKQLRSFFRGTMVGYYQETRKISIQATRAGTLLAWFEGKVDTGTWKIVGNQVCVSFKVWTSGKPKCRFVERRGNWLWAVKANGESKIKFRR